jgi:DNA invertase Pin-like site-specific DNA recombinase
MRYVIFSRVSTGKKKTAEGETVKQTTENQIVECMQYVKDNMKEGDEIIQFDEEGMSTRKSIEERPVLKAMLASLKRGDTLVIYKLNRLARAGDELVMIWHDLQRRGINLVSLYEKQIDEMIIHAYAMVGQAERKNIREATKSGLRRKQLKMEKVGACWYGYTTDPTKLQTYQSDCHSHGKPYLLIPEESEHEQVNLMVEWHSQGLTYGQIASELETKGFRNRKGNPVHKMTVYRVLQRLKTQNPAPTGLAFAK